MLKEKKISFEKRFLRYLFLVKNNLFLKVTKISIEI